jgi:hypothetical protein
MRRTALLLATSLLVAACSDSSGPSGDSINGTYALRTVNGQNLPFPVLVIGTDFRLEVLSGSLTVNGNGTFSFQLTLRETELGTVDTETQTTTGRGHETTMRLCCATMRRARR